MESKLLHQREAKALTGLPASTLRYWESQFAQLKPRRDGHGNRYYTEEDIALIKRIRFIRDELHITRIEAIQKELEQDDHHADSRHQVTDILQHVRDQLTEIASFL